MIGRSLDIGAAGWPWLASEGWTPGHEPKLFLYLQSDRPAPNLLGWLSFGPPLGPDLIADNQLYLSGRAPDDRPPSDLGSGESPILRRFFLSFADVWWLCWKHVETKPPVGLGFWKSYRPFIVLKWSIRIAEVDPNFVLVNLIFTFEPFYFHVLNVCFKINYRIPFVPTLYFTW